MCQTFPPCGSIASIVMLKRERKKKEERISTHALCMSLESPSYNFTADEKKGESLEAIQLFFSPG